MKVCLSCGQRFISDGWCCPECGFFPRSEHGYPVFASDIAKTDDGFEADFFERLAGVESGNFWFESRNRLLVWAFRQYFPDAHNFLEIGCGTGFVLAGVQLEFPHLRLAGSDIFSEGLAYAGERVPDAAFFQMDARRIPFDGEFDVIGAFDVIEHIEDEEAVLSQMFRATKPGGGILLTVPQHPFLWGVDDEYAHHKRRYRRTELTEKVRTAGFEIVRVTGFVSLLLPFMLLARRRKSKSLDDYDPTAEFNISRSLNALLRKTLSLERFIIKGGVSFPVGGSLLIVAKRPQSDS